MQQAAGEPEVVRGFAKSLVKESRRLGELSRDVIQLSEAQSTLRPEDRERVHLRDLVRSEVESHREFATQNSVELVVTDDADTAREAVILGRPTSLGSAVANLLSNAIRYSPEGGRVGIGMSFDKDNFLVTVTDQGAGMPAEHLSRIFERFYRIDGARTRGEGGTGLGLSIARHTMRAHGGDVDVWSQPGVGSSFTLHFPVIDSNSGVSAKSAKRVKKARRIVKSSATRPAERQNPSSDQ
ncbi:sensor histidine kinase [Leucobacter coleopterorum]|uniref:sensor histidine kinase n=1 Tax=Leucobacter coleopterorum TaxID=2714933 RepID=UPI001FCB2661|nr:HAMP domain-containing sensor histidine kinase [Leucobacter coleopterorum]